VTDRPAAEQHLFSLSVTSLARGDARSSRKSPSGRRMMTKHPLDLRRIPMVRSVSWRGGTQGTEVSVLVTVHRVVKVLHGLWER
jgi:hypothetical protein